MEDSGGSSSARPLIHPTPLNQRPTRKLERQREIDIVSMTSSYYLLTLKALPRHRPYSLCQSLKPSLVFLNRASYGRRWNSDVTSQEREVTMILRHNLRTDAQICGKSASQPSLFVRHGRGVNRVYWVALDTAILVIAVKNLTMICFNVFLIELFVFYMFLIALVGRDGSVWCRLASGGWQGGSVCVARWTSASRTQGRALDRSR